MISSGREDPEESLEKGIWKNAKRAEMKTGRYECRRTDSDLIRN
jgi:hypothetical protein